MSELMSASTERMSTCSVSTSGERRRATTGRRPAEQGRRVGHTCSALRADRERRLEGTLENHRKNGFKTRRSSNFRPFWFGSSRFNVQMGAQNWVTTQSGSQRRDIHIQMCIYIAYNIPRSRDGKAFGGVGRGGDTGPSSIVATYCMHYILYVL